jgi:hypothetical protein
MRRTLAGLVAAAGLVLSLASCGDSGAQPTDPAAPAGAGQQAGPAEAGSPGQELAGIGSTLDAIDSELASDGSP